MSVLLDVLGRGLVGSCGLLGGWLWQPSAPLLQEFRRFLGVTLTLVYFFLRRLFFFFSAGAAAFRE